MGPVGPRPRCRLPRADAGGHAAPGDRRRREHTRCDVDVHHHRRDGPADRPGRAGLRRDRARHERGVQLGQRPRWRRRPQDPLHVPRRRLQPGQHRDPDPQARAAGQHLRRRRVARDADPVGRAGLLERTEGAAALHRVGLQLLEQLEVPLQPRLAASVHGGRQDPRAPTSRRTSPARRSATCPRTTSSGRTSSRVSTWRSPRPPSSRARPTTRRRWPVPCPTRWRR